MGDLKYRTAERNLHGRGQDHELLEGNSTFSNNWARRYLCYNLAKNLKSCSENLSAAEF